MRSVTLIAGGDGVTDRESDVDFVNDTHILCRSYPFLPGYTHTDDVLISFRPTCAAGALVDTYADFTFAVDLRQMQLVSVHPKGASLAGGTPLTLQATNLGGRQLQCRFGFYTVAATYVDRNTLRCDTPAVAEPQRVRLEVSPDGERWTEPLYFTFFDAASLHVSAVWPLGGPDAGGTAITVFGSSFADYGGVSVRIGVGGQAQILAAHVLNTTALLAITLNVSNSTPIDGVRITLDGGGFDFGGTGPAARVGAPVMVSLNGAYSEEQSLLRGAAATFHVYPHAELRVSEVFPAGAHHSGGTEVTLYGQGFVDLGAARCAFGSRRSSRGQLPWDAFYDRNNLPPLNDSEAMEVLAVATILGPFEARCRSPRLTVHPAAPVPIELLLNGDRSTKTDGGLAFTFYGQPGAEVVISAMSPLGAPIAGGTQLTLYGRGFHDLGDVRLRFGKYGAVQAQVTGGGTIVTCVTPPATREGREYLAFSPDDATFVMSDRSFHFFDRASIVISSIAPGGGLSSGGTMVTLHGRRFVSLPASCLFGSVHVAATVVNSSVVLCAAPAPASVSSAAATVTLTLNGELGPQAVALGQHEYYYYNASAVRIDSVLPSGGPSDGGTVVTLRGAGFSDLGGVYCRFGSDTLGAVQATLVSAGELTCVSPPSPHRDAAGAAVGGRTMLAVTLNGDADAYSPSNVSFFEYLTSGLDVQLSSVLPAAGPSAGGSLLNVSGQGFAALGSVLCRFGTDDQSSAASVVSSSLIQCRSPAISDPLSSDGRVGVAGQREWLHVSLNGQEYTSSLVSFLAYDASRVHVSAVMPRGGPLAGGTDVLVLGGGFADYRAHCRFGMGPLRRATVLNSSALRCVTEAQEEASSATVEITLNGDIASRTADGVRFEFYNASAVRIDSVLPLGGPSDGGTVVTLRGAGFSDLGGVYCRFGSDTLGAVQATLVSAGELTCVSPPSPHRDAAGAAVGGRTMLAVTLNGDADAYSPSNVSFFEYLTSGLDVQLSSVLPAAGPSAGGSLLNVSGQGFAALGSVLCRFGTDDQSSAASVVSSSLIQCRSPAISDPLSSDGRVGVAGQREWLHVSLNGQEYTSSLVSFLAYDASRVHVSAVMPRGGPLAGGTDVLVLGGGFADYRAHCRFGMGPLRRATVLNSSALRCVTEAQEEASSATVEITLNGDIASRTADGVRFEFYNASAVRIDSVLPLGGPSDGGTVVTLRGAGFSDLGGVYCRFGADVRRAVQATLVSAGELTCVSPPLSFRTAPALWESTYRQVHATASCCTASSPDGLQLHLGSTTTGTAQVAADCEPDCNNLTACRFFSHSLDSKSCTFCSDCMFDRSDGESLRTSWQRLGEIRTPVRVRILLGRDPLPNMLDAPEFVYYPAHSLTVSAATPIGGPVAGGTLVTLHGRGFSPVGTVYCHFGTLGPQPATIISDGSSLRCTSPAQPDPNASFLSVRSINSGQSLPPAPRRGLSHRYTSDGCAASGAAHAPHCTEIATGNAAVVCCALDGQTCQSMCVSSVGGEPLSPQPFPLEQPGGRTNAFVSLEDAERACDHLGLRLCSLDELASGVCCSGGCAFDDARVWSSDDCTLPSEHTPIEALPMRPERLRVSINGQQYSGMHFDYGTPAPIHGSGAIAVPATEQTLRASAVGFTYYDASQLVLSAVIPRTGPVAGGTTLTLIGAGFVDFGAAVGFVSANGTQMASALLAVGAMRGRVLTCVSPASPAGAAGSVLIEISLNGAAAAPAMTSFSTLRFDYHPDAVGSDGADSASGEVGSGEASSGEVSSGDLGSGDSGSLDSPGGMGDQGSG